MCHDKIIDLYDRHAHEYDCDRARVLQERTWLDRFLRHVPQEGTILDVGCGLGEPIASYFVERGYRVVGVDSSPSMIALCRHRHPTAEWLVGDMRALTLHRQFDGVIAWDSFFHLCPQDQREMFPRFRNMASRRAPVMFTSGPSEGKAIGSYCGEPLYHGSLSAAEYDRLLQENDFSVEAHQVEDPDCGGHTIWLAIATG
jgi:SAM-dependent methyltransferase